MKPSVNIGDHSARKLTRSRIEHRTSIFFTAVLFCSILDGRAADGPVKAVQETLKKEQYLFEEPSGKLDDATRGALRRFQIRRGLPATGEPDVPTLQALESSAEGAVPAAASEPPPGKVTRLAAATVARDREFLEEVEKSEGSGHPELKASPQKEPAQLAPPPITPAAALTDSSRVSDATGSETGSPTSPLHLANTEISKSEADTALPKSQTLAKHRPIASRKAETGQLVQRGETTLQRGREPGSLPPAAGSEHRVERVIPSPVPNVEDVQAGPPGIASPSARVVTYTAKTNGPDGRTYIYEGRLVAPEGDDTFDANTRRDEPVERRVRPRGFFHRLFHGE